jgi:hypothetical protein
VPVVAHDAVAAHTHVEPLDALGEDAFESVKVASLLENPRTAIGTIQNVLNNVSQIVTFTTRHNV